MRNWAGTVLANDLPPKDDSELLTLCLEGDESAWEVLLARYQRLIYSIPIKMGLSPNDAADIFQTVCMRLLKSLSTLRYQDRISSWLTVTTRREAWRIAARRRREQVLVPIDRPVGVGEVIDPPSDEPPLDEQQRLLEQQQILRDGIAALPERCRQLIGLLFYSKDELGYHEIARRMNIPRSSMGPTRARCLSKLRKLLEGKL
jgi:RNA polymerase sigma factor (sigma-70 family)